MVSDVVENLMMTEYQQVMMHQYQQVTERSIKDL